MLNPFQWSFRAQFFAGFVVCLAMLVYAIGYIDITLGVEPCDKCILQRVAFMLMGLFFLLGAIHNPQVFGRRIYALLVLFAAIAGAAVAIQHIWLQHQPPDPMGGCSPGLSYMIENLPVNVWIKRIFSGHADCAVISWTVFGLSAPFWTLVSYILLGAGALWAGMRKRVR